MKAWKKIAGVLLALIMVLGLAQTAPMTVSAASAKDKGVTEYPSKVRIYPKSMDNYAIEVGLASSDYYLKAVKSSSKNLKAKITSKYSSYSTDSDGTVNRDEGEGAVGLYTAKKGKYKVTITVGKKSDSKFSKTISVQVFAYDDSPFKSVKAGGKDILNGGNQYYFSQKTLTFKATAAKGYKIQKIEVGKYKKTITNEEKGNYNTELTWTTIKNGKSFKLSNVKNSYKNSYSNSYSGVSYSYKNVYKYIRSSLAAETIVKVTYTDKYTKQADEAWFYFYYIKL